MDLRQQQKLILESDPKLTTGDVTTINMTQIYVSVLTYFFFNLTRIHYYLNFFKFIIKYINCF